MKTKEKILDYVRKKPMVTAEQITGELGINHETVIASLSSLKRKGKVRATDSWPTK
jgi:predicted ArsR family transcriptional regulator